MWRIRYLTRVRGLRRKATISNSMKEAAKTSFARPTPQAQFSAVPVRIEPTCFAPASCSIDYLNKCADLTSRAVMRKLYDPDL